MPLAYAVVSTYPPTPCGIATFSAALCHGLAATGAEVGVVRIGEAPRASGTRVIGTVSDSDPGRAADALYALNQADVAIVQHEYGIYAGDDGDSILDLLAAIDIPTVVVAHTVLEDPTPRQRAVLEAVAHAADAVVVMTDAGQDRLRRGFDIDPDKVSVIPHGAAVAASVSPERGARGRLLTWGLLGPGKGIEWAIDALAALHDLDPRPEYLIAGATHPKVLAHEGEAYREMLEKRVAAAGIADHVTFDADYRDLPALADLIASSSVVVLPYDSPDQVTSGVLVDAVAAGRPVVATAFPHAVELLATGAGLVVPRRDPDALAAALRRVLTEPGLATSMAAEARRIAPSLAWPAIAARYARVGESLRAPRAAVPA